MCLIPSAQNPAVLWLVYALVCCITPRCALISSLRRPDVPDNSCALRLLSPSHTRSEQVPQKWCLCWMLDKNANRVTGAQTLRRVWNDYQEPRPWKSISATRVECNSPTRHLTNTLLHSHAWKHTNTRRLCCQRGLLFHVFPPLSLMDTLQLWAAWGPTHHLNTDKSHWLTRAWNWWIEALVMNRLPLFVHFVFMQITERAELYQHLFDYLQQLSMICRLSPRVHGCFSESHSTDGG